MNKYRAIQTIALNSVLKKTTESQLNHIFRWFSREFSTPLHLVEEMSLEYILTQYYEDCYENMTKEELEKERIDLSLDENDIIAREEEDDEFVETIKKQIKQASVPTPIASSVKNIHPITKEELEKELEQWKDIKMTFD